MAGRRFSDKESARRWVWDELVRRRLARFPLPPHGRIPNFAGAKEAAARLLDAPPFDRAHRIKVNPDAPQAYVREAALERGITVLMPTPRLRAGFLRLDPARIPLRARRQAARLSGAARFAQEVPLRELPELDAIVCGSVAVTRRGHRCGKGHGYGDLEFAILRELGHPPVPVATTVHPVQIVGGFPPDPNDLPLSLIVTPGEVLNVAHPPPAPAGIEWDRLRPEDLSEMPVLAELRRLRPGR